MDRTKDHPFDVSELFVRVEDKMAADPNVSFTVEVSYIEVCKIMPLTSCTLS